MAAGGASVASPVVGPDELGVVVAGQLLQVLLQVLNLESFETFSLETDQIRKLLLKISLFL